MPPVYKVASKYWSFARAHIDYVRTFQTGSLGSKRLLELLPFFGGSPGVALSLVPADFSRCPLFVS